MVNFDKYLEKDLDEILNERLESKLRNYKKYKNNFEFIQLICAITSAAVILFMQGDLPYKNSCILVPVLVPILILVVISETFLRYLGFNVKNFIQRLESVYEQEFRDCSKNMETYGKLREDLISHEMDITLSEGSLELIKKEKLNLGWLSKKVGFYEYKCKSISEKLKDLREKKRLVNN